MRCSLAKGNALCLGGFSHRALFLCKKIGNVADVAARPASYVARSPSLSILAIVAGAKARASPLRARHFSFRMARCLQIAKAVANPLIHPNKKHTKRMKVSSLIPCPFAWQRRDYSCRRCIHLLRNANHNDRSNVLVLSDVGSRKPQPAASCRLLALVSLCRWRI